MFLRDTGHCLRSFAPRRWYGARCATRSLTIGSQPFNLHNFFIMLNHRSRKLSTQGVTCPGLIRCPGLEQTHSCNYGISQTERNKTEGSLFCTLHMIKLLTLIFEELFLTTTRRVFYESKIISVENDCLMLLFY